jgi:CysZ protein
LVFAIIEGVMSYLQALNILLRPGFKRFILIPGFFSLLLAIAILYSAVSFRDDIASIFLKFYPWENYKSTAKIVSEFFSGFLLIFLGYIIFRHVLNIIIAPIMSMLSEKVEHYVLGKPTPTTTLAQSMHSIWRGISLNIRNLFRELLYVVSMAVPGMIPFISPFSTTAILITQAYFSGFGNMDFTLERYLGVKDSLKFVETNRWAAIVNGIIYTFILAIPVFGQILAPAIGGTAAAIIVIKKLDIK